MLVFLLRSPIAEHAHASGKAGIFRDYHAAFAIRAQVLARIKAEAAHVTQPAHSLSLICRAMSLRSIFNHPEVVLARNFENWVHVRGLAVEVYGKDRASCR